MSAELVALKAAESIGSKVALPASRAFWRWWRGGEIGDLVRRLKRVFGDELEGLPFQPDAVGLLWVLRATGDVDIDALAQAVRPLWWRRPEDEARRIASDVAAAIVDRYREVLHDDDLARYQAREIRTLLVLQDVERHAAEREALERRLQELTVLVDFPYADALLHDDGPMWRTLGVSPSSIADTYRCDHEGPPPYVPRISDERFAEAINGSRFALLSGPSKAGKSRTALHAVATTLGGYQIAAPRVRSVAHELLHDEFLDLRSAPDEPIVLWLDDLDRYLSEDTVLDGSFFRATLERRPGLTIVATLQSSARSAPRVRAVLPLSTQVGLDGRLSNDELNRAKQLYPNESLTADVRLGEYFVAADDLVARLESAEDEVQDGLGPFGAAVVMAAVDLRRIGISRPIPREALWRLYTGVECDSYVRLRGRLGGRLTKETFDHALDAATNPIASSIALLEDVSEQGLEMYEPFDFVVAYVRGDTHFEIDPPNVPLAAYVVAFEDLVAGGEDFALVGSTVAMAGSLGREEQARLATAIERGVARGGVGVDAALLAVRGLASSQADHLVDALADIAGAAFRNGWPKDTILTAAVATLLRSDRPDRASPLLAAIAEHWTEHVLATSTLANVASMLIRAGREDAAEQILRRLDEGMGKESMTPDAALKLLFSFPAEAGANQPRERIQRLLGVVGDKRVDEPTRAHLLVRVLRSRPADVAPFLLPSVIESINVRRVDGRLAAKVAHAVHRAGLVSEADHIFSLMRERTHDAEIGLAAQAEVLGRLARVGRLSEVDELIDVFCERLERRPLPAAVVDVVAGRLKQSGRPDLGERIWRSVGRGR